MEDKIAAELGFEGVVPVSGQTYSRKVDYAVLSTLSGIAQSASKFATDLRLLCHLKEVEEPFEKNQIGSSAMPYKRNPMRCERICSLARYVMADALNPAVTAASQWFERTLDDSANKRLSVPEAFLAVDAILNIYENVASGLVVHEQMIARHVREELPFMASENIMMVAVKKGGDRQALHERIRLHSIEAGKQVKDLGLENDLIDLNFMDIQNVVALRGDAIPGQKYFTPEPDGHRYSNELVAQIHNMNQGIYLDETLTNAVHTNFCIGVAAYPEKHYEAPNLDIDIENLKHKVEAGADYIVTQMFFDNAKFYRFTDNAGSRNHGPHYSGIKAHFHPNPY